MLYKLSRIICEEKRRKSEIQGKEYDKVFDNEELKKTILKN